MNYLNRLIKEFCPHGVTYLKLENFLKIKNGGDYKHLGCGTYPVYGSGGIMTYVDSFVYDKPSVLIPRKGSIDKLYYVTEPFWNVDTVFYTDIDVTVAIPKYVYFCLQKSHLEQYNTAGGVPSLTQKVLNCIRIPLPPLAVQQEIVRILDSFTELTTELNKKLTAELTARRKQYEHYRDELLTFAPEVEWKTIGEVCKLSAGGDVPKERFSKNKTEEYTVPILSNGIGENALYGFTDIAKIKAPCVTVAARGTIGYCELRNEDFYPVVRLICACPKEELLPAYLKYYLETIKFQVPTSGIPQLTVPMLSKYKIPIPTLAEQGRIVAILDKFSAICNDLTSGLPAEIAARQKQYEYYRDKLLTFGEKEN